MSLSERCQLLLINRVVPWLQKLDDHMKEVVKGASIALTLRVLAAVLSFGVNIVLARIFGATGTGIYYLAMTVTGVAILIGRLGLDNAVLRFIAENAAKGEWGKIAGLYRKTILIALTASGATTAVTLITADWIALSVFAEPALAPILRLMSLSILPMSLTTLYSEMLRGLKKILESVTVAAVSVPLLNILFVGVLGSTFGIVGAVVSYILSCVCSVLFSILVWYRSMLGFKDMEGYFDARLLMKTSFPLFWMSLMNFVMASSDTAILGIFSDAASVGVYGVAARTASLTAFILVAVNTIIAPKFAALYACGDYQSLAKLARSSAKLSSLVALPILCVFAAVPVTILNLFGPEFTQGAACLRILAVGQFFNVATGSVGYLLIMTGHERLMRNNAIFSTVIGVILQLLLVPRFGLIGSALATSLTLIGINVISTYLVYRKLSFIPLPLPRMSGNHL